MITGHQLAFLALIAAVLTGCTEKKGDLLKLNIATDESTIPNGEHTFKLFCSPCHSFRQDEIGPALGGITKQLETDWIRSFISNPRKMRNEKDKRAMALYEEYTGTMPPFSHLGEQKIEEIIAYIHSVETIEDPIDDIGLPALDDLLPDRILMSEVSYDLDLKWQLPTTSDHNPHTRINNMTCEKKSGRLFICDLRGYIYELGPDDHHPYLNIRDYIADFTDAPGLGTGLGSVAFHPDFSNNGLFYTAHSEPPRTQPADFAIDDSVVTELQSVIVEWKMDDPSAITFEGTHRELLRIDMVTGKHGIQEIAFNNTAKNNNPDFGMLYICIGEGAAVEHGFPELSNHHGSKIWGSIIRIDPMGNNSANQKYGIPDDNPFVKNNSKNKLPELWAYGFRNPHRISWSAGGLLIASDIGARSIEEINIISPGHFYGWPAREGRFFINYTGNITKAYALPQDDTLSVTYPVASYDHDEGRAISGGYFYYGNELSLLSNKYVFGDITPGTLFFSDLKPDQEEAQIWKWQPSVNGKIVDLKELCGSNRVDLRVDLDCEGNLYLFTKPDGKVYRLRELKKEVG